MNDTSGTDWTPMRTKDIREAKDPVLRASMAALQRASLRARQIAIQTGTNLVIVKNGQLLRISPEELRQSAEGTTPLP
jgi:hypothetical protein